MPSHGITLATPQGRRPVLVCGALIAAFVLVAFLAGRSLGGERHIAVPDAVLVLATVLGLAALGWALRQAALLARARAGARFASLVDHANDAIVVIDAAGRVIDCNARAESMSGYARAALLGRDTFADLTDVTERSRASRLLAEVFDGGAVVMEADYVGPDGRRLPVEISARLAQPDDTPVAVAVVRDVSDRRAAEMREKRLAGILRTVSEINHLIVRETDRARLLQRACEVLVEHGGFQQAWLGRAEPEGRVVPEAQAGAATDLVDAGVRWDAGPDADGPTGRALRERRLTVAVAGAEAVATPWGRRAAANGFAATAAAPLVMDGELWGVLTLSSAAADAFDARSRSLILELADDLAFALRALQQVRALSASEERLRAFFASGVIGILFGDIHGRVHDANDELLRIVGVERADLAAGPIGWTTITPPKWADADARGLAEARARGACTPYEKELVRTDGAIIPVLVGYTLLEPEREQSVAFVMDLSAMKAAVAEAARGAAALQQVAEAAIITDADGVIVDVNPAFERLTGYARSDVIGQNPRLLKSGRQDAAFYAAMWKRLKAGDVWSGAVTNRRKDGSEYAAAIVISPVRDATGQVVNYVGLQRDVSREQELDHRLNTAQRAEALGQLTGGIAHDFNNLLTVILSNLSLAEAEAPAGASGVREYLGDIGNAARHGSALVRKLLAFGRRSRLTLEPLDLNEAAEQAARLFRRVIPEHIAVRCERAERLPPVLADPGAVEQMLLNLATNARDAMPEGGVLALRVETIMVEGDESASAGAGGPAGEYVALTVEDSGTGMTPQVLDRLFEPFFTTKPVGQGTGLGLSMIFGLMRQHRGFVRVASAVGRGTRFQLCFPGAVEAAPIVRAAAARPATARGGTETVLVVEDEPALRVVAQRLLVRMGYTVLVAADGEAGWESFQRDRGRIDLVVSDAVMPRLGGYGLLARIRESGSAVPFLLTSGYTDGVPGEDAPAAVPLLAKPWMPAELSEQVRALLDLSAAPVRPETVAGGNGRGV